ncbi:YceI family protein [Streptomyces griseoruber]|uniref:YceI family protein n=1 Tax=Streptomyces griseoruber TaxID=1943 RepID=UPI00379E0938
MRQTGGATFQVAADLGLHGVTRPVTVDFERTGTANDPRGALRVDFTGRATTNRRDWTVNGADGLVGERVTRYFDVSAIRRP